MMAAEKRASLDLASHFAFVLHFFAPKLERSREASKLDKVDRRWSQTDHAEHEFGLFSLLGSLR